MKLDYFDLKQSSFEIMDNMKFQLAILSLFTVLSLIITKF